MTLSEHLSPRVCARASRVAEPVVCGCGCVCVCVHARMPACIFLCDLFVRAALRDYKHVDGDMMAKHSSMRVSSYQECSQQAS